MSGKHTKGKNDNKVVVSPEDTATPHSKRKKKKKLTKGQIIKRVMIGVIVCLFLVAGGIFTYIAYLLNSMDVVDIPKDDTQINISDQYQDKKYDGIRNIAVFGVDRRGGNANTRSDVIIILTLDNQHKKIKATSRLRDSYVSVEGYGKTKLTHAYAYGGPELAIKTINSNFNMNIRDFVTVDFDSMAKIVDAVGGVDIEVTQGELESLNKCIDEYADAYDIEERTYVTSAGMQHLNGMQACGYARVRYDHNNGDDRRRTDRQRRVMEEVFNKALTMDPAGYLSLAQTLLPLVETSFSAGDLIDLVGEATDILTNDGAEFEQARFPMDVDASFPRIDGMEVVDFDHEVTNEKLYNFIFEDIDPSATTTGNTSTTSKNNN